jgi:hypothetical protein
MTPQDRQDIDADIRRIEELFSSGIFDSPNSGHVLLRSAFVDLMICLRDLLHKCEKYASRVSFTDDVLVNGYVHDVTDLVTTIRDACCHIDSFKRLFDTRGNRGSFLVGYGKVKLLKMGDVELQGDYEDDIAVFFGTNRIYLRRHVVRSFEEAKSRLAEHLK